MDVNPVRMGRERSNEVASIFDDVLVLSVGEGVDDEIKGHDSG